MKVWLLLVSVLVATNHLSADDTCCGEGPESSWASYQNFQHRYQFRFPPDAITFFATGPMGERSGDNLRFFPAMEWGNPPLMDVRVLEGWERLVGWTIANIVPRLSASSAWPGRFFFSIQVDPSRACMAKCYSRIRNSFREIGLPLSISDARQDIPSECDRSLFTLTQRYSDPTKHIEISFPGALAMTVDLKNYPENGLFDESAQPDTKVLVLESQDHLRRMHILLEPDASIDEIVARGRRRFSSIVGEDLEGLMEQVAGQGTAEELIERELRSGQDGSFTEVVRKGVYASFHGAELCWRKSAVAILRSFRLSTNEAPHARQAN